KPHRSQKLAVPNAVADHAEHRCNQRPDILQGSEDGEQQHRAGLDHDVPAEHERLDLERPGGEEIGRPLKAIAADAEWRERGDSCSSAQVATTRVTAFPALVLNLLVGMHASGGGIVVNQNWRGWAMKGPRSFVHRKASQHRFVRTLYLSNSTGPLHPGACACGFCHDLASTENASSTLPGMPP